MTTLMQGDFIRAASVVITGSALFFLHCQGDVELGAMLEAEGGGGWG